MTTISLSRIGRLAVDLFYPPRCALCERFGALLCTGCLDSMPRADGLRCSVCWLPLRGDGACYQCQEGPRAFTALRSAFRYEGKARELVHGFKFRDLSSLSEVMAAEMSPLVDRQTDVIVPVPLSGSRQRERGYNQSRLLARALSTSLQLPLADALKRTRSSRPQTRSFSREERRQNVEGAFSVRRPGIVTGLRVLLVDDVATTGATLDACARALLAAGALEVRAVTFARED
jgi:ComF family protein